MKKFFQAAFIFIVSAPAIVALIGALIYVVHGLDKIGVYTTIILSLMASFLIIYHNLKKEKLTNEIIKIKNIPKNEWLAFGIFLASWLTSLCLLYLARSDRALLTPWQVVNSYFFLSYGLGVACLFILSRFSSKLVTTALILQSLLLFSIATIVYRIGYGFDPFIHEAAVKAIEKLGQIKPLTPYYLGQYSLMTVLHALTKIDLAFWSKILVPSLAGLILPLIIMRWLKNHHGTEKDWSLATVFLLLMPATIFIVTTPQNLAYLFLLIVIFWPSPIVTTNEKIIVWLCALAALFTQPVAGIPAILLALADTTQNKKIDKLAYPIIISLLVLALPAAFYIFSALDNSTAVSLTWPNLKFLTDFLPHNPSRENWWLNFIYLYDGLWGIIIFILTIIGLKLSFSNLPAGRPGNNSELRRRFAWPSLALLLSALITSMINFHFLIDYERSDYTVRLIIVALLFVLPLIINTFRELAILIERANLSTRLTWLIIITAAAVASIYLSYPRFDHYFNSHGYASSKADSLAVEWIDNDSHNEPYVVLANQQVSAAALRAYGFNHYYKNLFYYPVPTGGELYQQYLAMVKEPSLAIIKQTRALTGVEQVYFVLDSYWWDFQKLADKTYVLANETQNIGDGQVVIFKFSKPFKK